MSTLRSALGSWFAPLLIHGLNQQESLQRAASAKAQGLDPAQFGTPFPGGNVTNTTTTNNSAKGWIPGALLATVLLGMGGATTAVAPGLLKGAPPTTAPTPTVPAVPNPSSPTSPPVTPASKAAEGDFVKWKINPDGTRTETGRIHVRTNPDGTQEQRQPDGTWVPFKGVE